VDGLVFSARSQQDLQRIVAYIARDNPHAAEQFGLSLIDHAVSLADTPEIEILMPERPGTRFIPLVSYLIIYRVDSRSQTVRILPF
jgi:plasmid stabilization system protein ParE